MAVTVLGGCGPVPRLPGATKFPVVGMLDPGREMGTFEQVFQDALAALGRGAQPLSDQRKSSSFTLISASTSPGVLDRERAGRPASEGF
jgi:hypothetical protein